MSRYSTSSELEAQVGEHFRSLRLRANIQQVDLALRADVSLSAIKNLETGKGTTLRTVVRVAKALVPPDRLDRWPLPGRARAVGGVEIPALTATGMTRSSAAFFDPPQLTATTAIGSTGCSRRGVVDAIDTPHLDLLGRWLRGHVVVERSRFGLLDVLIEHDADDDVLMASLTACDADAIAFADRAVRLRRAVIHLHLAAFACALGFRARLEEAGDVQPDVEAKALAHDQIRISTLPFERSPLTNASVCS